MLGEIYRVVDKNCVGRLERLTFERGYLLPAGLKE